MSIISRTREAICEIAKSMFDRGLTHGSTGNISVRVDDGWLMTPTGSSMGTLDPAQLSLLDGDARHIDGDPPTKESILHIAMYQERETAGAVVHLHAPYSTAVSCLADLNPENVLPPLTPYYIMRVGRLPLVPYFRPGDVRLADAVREKAGAHHAILLANHGSVVAGTSLSQAVDSTEELEATARLYLLLGGQRLSLLTEDHISELAAAFPT